MNFGEALQALKEGKNIKRSIWGGFWYLANNVDANHSEVNEIAGFDMPQMIVAVLRNNGGSAPAQPYQADLLAEDWEIV